MLPHFPLFSSGKRYCNRPNYPSEITTACYLDGGNAEVIFHPAVLFLGINNDSGSIFAIAAADDEVTFDWECNGDKVCIDGGVCNAQIIA